MGCLLVEDQTLMAELMRRSLQTSPKIGLIRIAQSAVEACRLIDGLPPDLLILDEAIAH